MAAPATGAERARRFSRFWTREIGLLDEGLLDTTHSLTEARVIYELGQVPETTATALAQVLALDAGHLSRVLGGLGDPDRRAEALAGRRAAADAVTHRCRARRVRRARSALGRAGHGAARAPPPGCADAPGAMAAIEELLGDDGEPASLVLRQPLPGEYGWVIQRHGALYAREYGFDTSFEALVAKIVAEFADHPQRSRSRARVDRRSTATPWARSSASTPARASRSSACSCRAGRARSPCRQAARRRVRPLRPRGRLSRADPVDAEQPPPRNLCPRRLRARDIRATEHAVRHLEPPRPGASCSDSASTRRVPPPGKVES